MQLMGSRQVSMAIFWSIILIISTFSFQNCSQEKLNIESFGDTSSLKTIVLRDKIVNFEINEGNQYTLQVHFSSALEKDSSFTWQITAAAGSQAQNYFRYTSGSAQALTGASFIEIPLDVLDDALNGQNLTFNMKVTSQANSEDFTTVMLSYKDNDGAKVFSGSVSACLIKGGALSC